MLLQGCVNGGVYPVVQVAPERRQSPRAGGSGRMRPVERDDGERYPSATSAAAEVGASGNAVWQAIARGGTCKGHRFRFVGEDWVEPRNGMPVVCCESGMRWSSTTKCAADIGVSPSCVSSHVRSGKPLGGVHYRRG